MPVTVTARPTAYTALLAGYLTGSVDDVAMRRLDDVFEDAPASAQERLAFARFYLDALSAGEADDAIPAPSEVAGILDVARA